MAAAMVVFEKDPNKYRVFQDSKGIHLVKITDAGMVLYDDTPKYHTDVVMTQLLPLEKMEKKLNKINSFCVMIPAGKEFSNNGSLTKPYEIDTKVQIFSLYFDKDEGRIYFSDSPDGSNGNWYPIEICHEATPPQIIPFATKPAEPAPAMPGPVAAAPVVPSPLPTAPQSPAEPKPVAVSSAAADVAPPGAAAAPPVTAPVGPVLSLAAAFQLPTEIRNPFRENSDKFRFFVDSSSVWHLVKINETDDGIEWFDSSKPPQNVLRSKLKHLQPAHIEFFSVKIPAGAKFLNSLSTKMNFDLTEEMKREYKEDVTLPIFSLNLVLYSIPGQNEEKIKIYFNDALLNAYPIDICYVEPRRIIGLVSDVVQPESAAAVTVPDFPAAAPDSAAAAPVAPDVTPLYPERVTEGGAGVAGAAAAAPSAPELSLAAAAPASTLPDNPQKKPVNCQMAGLTEAFTVSPRVELKDTVFKGIPVTRLESAFTTFYSGLCTFLAVVTLPTIILSIYFSWLAKAAKPESEHNVEFNFWKTRERDEPKIESETKSYYTHATQKEVKRTLNYYPLGYSSSEEKKSARGFTQDDHNNNNYVLQPSVGC